MRRLILLRHAKTERASLTGRDHDRRLDERGLLDAPAMGRYLQQHDLLPGLTLVSSAMRTQQTWERVASQFVLRAESATLDDLYGASATELLGLARAANGRPADDKLQSLMIIAHNPGLHEFALDLTSAQQHPSEPELQDNLPTSGLVVIDFAIEDWNELMPGRGVLERFVTPRRLQLHRDND